MKYKQSGVDLWGSSQVKKEIKKLARQSYSSQVIEGVGPFGSLYNLSPVLRDYQNPVLVQSTDGVGTKLILAKEYGDLFSIGIDLVNHCLNDILALGARPLFFQDYLAQDRLRKKEVLEIIEGIVAACQINKISLIGGELAQLPGIYQKGKFDLVGTITGLVEKEKIIDGKKIRPGNLLLGLQSFGLHTNGYSLVRKIIKEKKLKLDDYYPEIAGKLGLILMMGHKNYFPSVFPIVENFEILGICHVTGGGIPGNLVRILPNGCRAEVSLSSFPILPIFKFLKKIGQISNREMIEVFNLGIGMILVCSQKDVSKIKKALEGKREKVFVIGQIKKGKREVILKDSL